MNHLLIYLHLNLIAIICISWKVQWRKIRIKKVRPSKSGLYYIFGLILIFISLMKYLRWTKDGRNSQTKRSVLWLKWTPRYIPKPPKILHIPLNTSLNPSLIKFSFMIPSYDLSYPSLRLNLRRLIKRISRWYLSWSMIKRRYKMSLFFHLSIKVLI